MDPFWEAPITNKKKDCILPTLRLSRTLNLDL